MSSEAIKLLQALFADAGGYLLLRFVKGNASSVVRFVSDINKINWDEAEQLNAKGYDCFFGVCPRRKGVGTKDGVTEVTCLWADIDAKEIAKGKEGAWYRIWTLPEVLRPSAVIDSGHGYHAYWFLDEPIRITGPEDIARIEGYIAGMRKLLGGDAVRDLSRLLRLPGTTNWKYPDHPVECHVDYLDPRHRFDLSHFDAYRVDIKQPGRTETIEITEVPPIPVSKLRVSGTIKNLILHPPDKGERSEAAWAVMQALIEAGYSDSEIHATMLANPIGGRYLE